MMKNLQDESRILAKQIKDLTAKLDKAPEGSLLCNKNGAHVKWFLSQDTSRHKYLPKKERALAEKLAMKKYYLTALLDAQKKKAAVDHVLSVYASSNEVMATIIGEKSPYKDLILPQFDSFSGKLEKWAYAEYETNTDYPENKKFHTKKGDLVRSKSEIFIADTLFLHKIPYRYEQKLDLGKYGVVFPDFTVCHPRTHKIFYWEHFGMMDDEEYVQKAYRKLGYYTLSGYIPSINLITSFETKAYPMDPDSVERIVREFFL